MQNPSTFTNMSFDELFESYYNEDDNVMDKAMNIMQEWQEEIIESSSSNRTRKKRTYINREREKGHINIIQDYFSGDRYTDDLFRKRFRMRRPLFLRIVDSIENECPFFQMRLDATGRDGLSALQKCIAAIRMMAYAMPADAIDEYVRIGATTTLQCLKEFARGVIKVFGDEYLRKPTVDDVQRLLQIGEARGFPGMMGSVDCMHWEWKNCPIAWHGMFRRGDHKKATIMLEAVASADLWIWHTFFGVAGSNNDINVLDRSPLFNDVVEGRAPQVEYKVNGTQYNMGYYLADGIYPSWASFVNSIPRPQGEKRKLFAKCQEGARKDIERAFGVLQSRFAIISIPARLWKRSELGEVMKACIILHNMIVEDERDTYMLANDFQYEMNENIELPQVFHGQVLANFNQYRENNRRLRDRTTHNDLQSDLVEHIWQKFGLGYNNAS